ALARLLTVPYRYGIVFVTLALGEAQQVTTNEGEGRTMATILAARGRMTKDLVTPYHVGDQVVVLANGRQKHGRARVGDVGTIRRLFISDPNDGDNTFLMAYVKVSHGTSCCTRMSSRRPPR